MRIKPELSQLGNYPEKKVEEKKTPQHMEYEAQFTEIILAHLLGVWNFFCLYHILLTLNRKAH